MKVGAAAFALVALCGVASADDPLDRPEAFDVDRLQTPPGQAEFSFDGGGRIGRPDSSEVSRMALGITGWAASAQLGFLDRPMRLHTVRVKIFPIEQRETLALGGAVAIGPSFIVAARLAASHQSGDRLVGLGDDERLDPWVMHDLSIGARLRLAHRDPLSVFVRGQMTFGTGNDYQFAGESRYTASWMLIGRLTPAPPLVIAFTGGVRFRGEEVIVADRLLGDELFGAIGASYKLPAIRGLYCDANDVRVTAELHGVLGNDVGHFEGASPAEARVGIVSRISPGLATAVRVGKGIDDHIGAPRVRAMVELVYSAGSR